MAARYQPVTGTHCRNCNSRIAFFESRRTGRMYPVNVRLDIDTEVASPIDFHRCDPQAVATYRATQAPAAQALGGNVQGIFTLFDLARAKGIKFPKVRLETQDGTKVVFKQAGERSKYMGQILLTDGRKFGENKFFGRIDEAGRLIAGRDLTDSVSALVAAFAADPAKVGAAYGKRTGQCCFCGRHLETRESVFVGYGPICADKFGLPWGEVPQAEIDAPAVNPFTPEAIKETLIEAAQVRYVLPSFVAASAGVIPNV